MASLAGVSAAQAGGAAIGMLLAARMTPGTNYVAMVGGGAVGYVAGGML